MSNISVTDTAIQGVKIIAPLHVFEDHRGVYRELWNLSDYSTEAIGTGPTGVTTPNGVWCADDISVSRKNVLRGIHGDYRTWKLVSCLYGAFFLAVVDWRPDSPTDRQHIGITLSDRNYLSVLIPPGCGNGHFVLSETAIFHYKQSEFYSREEQFTIAWDDPALGIPWPISTYPILSERDSDVPPMRMTEAQKEKALYATIDNISLDASEFEENDIIKDDWTIKSGKDFFNDN